MVGVEDDVDHLDAEGIEHHLHPQTIKRLEKLISIQKKIKPNFINELIISV
jgi:Mn-dependent DtxR family transcriptional regulator